MLYLLSGVRDKRASVVGLAVAIAQLYVIGSVF